jgi:large subunit ribosomal protein L22
VPGLKTNEVPGTRAVLRHYRMSAYKARQVLDLVRGRDVDHAEEILRATPREAARVVWKVLNSAVANARNNEGLDPDELYVSACYADEGTTLKRWRPRARGRATRIRKRTCHITVIVSRLPEDRLERRRARQADRNAALRARRVAASRRATQETAPAPAVSATPGAVAEPEELEGEEEEATTGFVESEELEGEEAVGDDEADDELAEADVAEEAEVDEADLDEAGAEADADIEDATGSGTLVEEEDEEEDEDEAEGEGREVADELEVESEPDETDEDEVVDEDDEGAESEGADEAAPTKAKRSRIGRVRRRSQEKD